MSNGGHSDVERKRSYRYTRWSDGRGTARLISRRYLRAYLWHRSRRRLVVDRGHRGGAVNRSGLLRRTYGGEPEPGHGAHALRHLPWNDQTLRFLVGQSLYRPTPAFATHP